MNDLATAIKQARRTSGRSREQFAVDIGCSMQTVFRWETGVSAPTHHQHVVRLAEQGVPIEAMEAALGLGVAA